MKSALLIVDVQTGLVALTPPKVKDRVLPNISALLTKARSSGSTVFFVQHDGPTGHPLELITPGWAIHASVLPLAGEPVINKSASDAFYETKLAEELRRDGITHLTIDGGMTEYCVDTTCRRAVTLGYDVTLVADGHLTRHTSGPSDHRASQSSARRFCSRISFDPGQLYSSGFSLGLANA